MDKELKSFKKDKLQVKIYEKEDHIGAAAATFVANELHAAIQVNGEAKLVVGTGTSQFSFYKHLLLEKIDWGKVIIFHLDEYKGIPKTHPASFRRFLNERFVEKIHPQKVFYLEGDASDIEAEITRYELLLQNYPIDIACIGIGENGHIAFNDPPVADFNDPKQVKLVELDEACRKQQLGEGWFPTLEDVPKEALTLTVPAIMSSKVISCLVPGKRKAQAVFDTLNMEISTKCPASVLRTHPNALLYLDLHSASKLTR